MLDAEWATALDHRVARHVIDRYYQKYGNARAGLRYLTKNARAWRTSVIRSLARLREHGVLTIVRKGSGTRETEYGLNFDFVKKSNSDPKEATANSDPRSATTCGPENPTSDAGSDPQNTTESYLRSSLTSELTVSRKEATPAPASPPPDATLTLAPADAAVAPKKELTGFEELWAAYPLKMDKVKSRSVMNFLR